MPTPTLRMLSLVGKIGLLALAYLISGRLAMLLAIPPGFVSAIFPPVGVALAAVLIWGYPLLLGVFWAPACSTSALPSAASSNLAGNSCRWPAASRWGPRCRACVPPG